MFPDKIVFDTNILLDFLKQSGSFMNLQDMFPDSDLFISEITEFELLSFWNITSEEEAAILCLFQDLVIVPFDKNIKKLGINFRRVTHAKTPDAIIAATAIVLDAVLFTGDDKLQKAKFPGYAAFFCR